ncbi:GHMP kinase [Mariniphaga sediminis]|jgi:glucuronokinase|uniref:GHMP kinase n=1 Tax=Mariniphaga sediminis TaxID=1628158 RepID=A0A399D6Q3_9BACT|nr:GHMP kinase [Mariniphaga sediminis]RIH67023.1 GHMP kinase [Mariniphaga sediminis]
MIIETFSYPRAAVIGNPSDGYFGKTIAFLFSNFQAKVQLYQTPELDIQPQRLDNTRFHSIRELVENVNLSGYYGGIRLLKATIKVFYDYCRECNIQLDNRNFTIRYDSNIPLRLGLAGSSAIITACMKALISFYGVAIPKPILANLVLSVEDKELGIAAGLQDRVAQAYSEPVYMDFNKKTMEKQGFGNYEVLDASLFPNMYIAFRKNLSEGTEVLHNNLRARFNIGEEKVLEAMKTWAGYTEDFREALKSHDYKTMHELINANFDLRRNLIAITPGNIEMVEAARSVGASAKFTGSGGAIIGTYENEEMYQKLIKALAKKNIDVIKPNIVN